MTRAILVLSLLLATFAPQTRPTSLVREIEQSTDLAWLERLCTDYQFAATEDAARRPYVSVKNSRSAAYVRLGALGTPESIAAIARIEAAARGQSILPPPIVPGRLINHPAPHMGEPAWQIAAQATLPDGRQVGAVALDWYGPRSLFLATRTGDRWSRARLVPVPLPHDPTLSLEPLPEGRIRIRFRAAKREGALMTHIHPTPDAVEVTLAETERDSDGDGWTDVEEQYLELGFRSRDSDGDGIPDDRDVTPSYKSDTTARESDDAQILQRAIFAMFGLTASPGALFVADDSRKLQLYGLPGPVFYRDVRGGAVRVTWKILQKAAAEATVELTDFENVLAASGNAVRLRRIEGSWYVVSIRGLWIS